MCVMGFDFSLELCQFSNDVIASSGKRRWSYIMTQQFDVEWATGL